MSTVSVIERTNFKTIAESDVVRNIIQFLGLKESGQRFCKLSKLCHRKHRELYTTTKISAVPAAFVAEKEGRLIYAILDALRWAVVSSGLADISPAAQKTLRNMSDLHKLYNGSQVEDLFKLNVLVYSYWLRTPSGPGMFPWLKELVKMNTQLKWSEAIDRDVQYWKDSKAAGDFFVLFDREDGCVLVSSDFGKVYLVLGLDSPVGFVFRGPSSTNIKSPTLHKNRIGMRVMTTLLNWNGQIIFDGVMMNKGQMTMEQLARAIRAYTQAVDKGTLITSLDRKLVPIAAPSSSSRSATKPVSKSPPTTIPVEHTASVNAIIARVAAARCLFDINDTALVNRALANGGDINAAWVFRRHGVTELTNRNHLVTVMRGMSPLIPVHQYSALVPTIYDILLLVDLSVKAARGKPGSIGIDVEYAVDALDKLLSPVGVMVVYNPPITAEEQAYINSTNPYYTEEERINGVSRCALCHTEYGEAMGPLLKCGRCKNEFYCCKDHQKVHWKKHKLVCVQI